MPNNEVGEGVASNYITNPLDSESGREKRRWRVKIIDF